MLLSLCDNAYKTMGRFGEGKGRERKGIITWNAWERGNIFTQIFPYIECYKKQGFGGILKPN